MQQGLSPLQIQTIKLLELPTLELEQRIKKELEENPVLDEAAPSEESEDGESKNVSLSDYNQDDSTPSYRLYVNNQGKDLKPQYNTFSVKESFHQNLEMQLGYSDLKGDDRKIAMFVIGSIDDDGYLRRDIESLTDDIAFRLNIETTPEHVEKILKVIQEFEPVGVGARDLRECLLLQLRVKEQTPERKRAEEILENYFEEFSRKHYDKIMARTGMNKDELKDAVDEIVHLNPRPGGQIDDSYVEQAQQIVPDFILENKDGELLLTMPKFSVPELRVNKRYADLLMNSAASSGKRGKEAVSGSTAPCLCISREAGIRSMNFHLLTGFQFLHPFFQTQDRTRTLYATGIYYMYLFAVRTSFSRFTRAGYGTCFFRLANWSDCRIVGLDSSYQVAHILITVFFQNVRGQITAQANLTMHNILFALIQSGQRSTQLPQRDILRAWN